MNQAVDVHGKWPEARLTPRRLALKLTEPKYACRNASRQVKMQHKLNIREPLVTWPLSNASVRVLLGIYIQIKIEKKFWVDHASVIDGMTDSSQVNGGYNLVYFKYLNLKLTWLRRKETQETCFRFLKDDFEILRRRTQVWKTKQKLRFGKKLLYSRSGSVSLSR